MSLIPIRSGSPIGGEAERSDAARNRELLLKAARELIEECGADGLTMDRLAERYVQIYTEIMRQPARADARGRPYAGRAMPDR